MSPKKRGHLWGQRPEKEHIPSPKSASLDAGLGTTRDAIIGNMGTRSLKEELLRSKIHSNY